jgi:hypothetical protein
MVLLQYIEGDFMHSTTYMFTYDPVGTLRFSTQKELTQFVSQSQQYTQPTLLSESDFLQKSLHIGHLCLSDNSLKLYRAASAVHPDLGMYCLVYADIPQ